MRTWEDMGGHGRLPRSADDLGKRGSYPHHENLVKSKEVREGEKGSEFRVGGSPA